MIIPEKAGAGRRFIACRKQGKIWLPQPFFCSLMTAQVNIPPNE
jgi:hypothetical protein